MAQLIYSTKSGGSAISYFRDAEKAKAVMSHLHKEAVLYTAPPAGQQREKIGEVFWHTDPGAGCTGRIGHAHWCYWFDADALAD